MTSLKNSDSQFYKRLVGFSPDIIFKMDLKNKKITYVNPALKETLGYTFEDFNSLGLENFISLDDQESLIAFIKELRMGHYSEKSFTFRGKHMQGHYLWLQAKISLITDEFSQKSTLIGNVRDVNEEKIKQDQLIASEKRFREVLKNAQDVSYRLNLKTGQFDYISSVIEQSTGYSLKEISYPFLQNKIKKEDLINSRLESDKILSETTACVVPMETIGRFLCKDNTIKWFSDKFTYHRDEQGNPLFTVGTLRDITYSMRQIDDIKRSEARFKEILEGTASISYHLNLISGEYEYISPVMEKISGYKQEMITHQFVLSHIHPEDVKRNMAELTYHLANSKSSRVDLVQDARFLCKNGEYKWFRDALTYVRNEKGTPIASIGSIQDITESKKVNLPLKESERQFRDVLEHSSDAAYKFDSINKKYEYLSPVVEKIFGFTHEEILSMSQEEVTSLIHPEDLPKFRFPEESIEVDPRLQLSHSLEYRSKSKNGEYFWIGDNHTVFRDEAGISQYIIGSLRNISDIKNREADLRRTVNEKNILLKEVHHRVKNNLQIISSMLNLQTGYYKDPEFLRIVENSKNRIESILVVYESLYKSENFESINFNQFIPKLIENIFRSYHIGSDQVQKVVDIGKISLNLSQSVPITLIFNEIISNSLKYAFPNNSKGKISVEFKTNPENFILTISDDGIGMLEKTDINKPRTFGLQLISILSTQLKGTLALNIDPGTQYILKFPRKINK